MSKNINTIGAKMNGNSGICVGETPKPEGPFFTVHIPVRYPKRSGGDGLYNKATGKRNPEPGNSVTFGYFNSRDHGAVKTPYGELRANASVTAPISAPDVAVIVKKIKTEFPGLARPAEKVQLEPSDEVLAALED